MMKFLLFTLAFLCCTSGAARAQGAAPSEAEGERLARVLGRAGERVESYQQGLFGIAFTEVLRREELREDMTAKRAQEFVFETVVVREALPAGRDDDYYPKSVRRLKSVDGRTPKRGEQPTAQFNVASLNFLLPKNLKPSEFSLEGEGQVEGRAAFRVRWRKPGDGEAKVEWKGTSFRVVSAPVVYLLWIDAETFDVLRLEARLAAPFEFESPRAFKSPFGRFGPTRRLRYAVQDYTASFRLRQFQEPEQTLLVPVSAEAVTVIEGASRPRWRTTLRFSDYRRFRADVKVVEEPDGEGTRR